MLCRRKDFHGGRAYDSDPSDKRKPRFGFRVSLVIRWIKLQLTRRTPVLSPSVPQGFPRRKGEGFPLVGSDGRDRGVRDLDTEIFPMADRRPQHS
jgi:hypothetical protein